MSDQLRPTRPTFERGDIVRLNSGGPEMTVTYVRPNAGPLEDGRRHTMVEATWPQGPPGVIGSDAFPEPCLTLVLKNEPQPIDTQFAWLIELASSPVSAPMYWSGKNHWTPESTAAARFVRRVDADSVAMSLGIPVRVCEHGWSDFEPSATYAAKLAAYAEEVAATDEIHIDDVTASISGIARLAHEAMIAAFFPTIVELPSGALATTRGPTSGQVGWHDLEPEQRDRKTSDVRNFLDRIINGPIFAPPPTPWHRMAYAMARAFHLQGIEHGNRYCGDCRRRAGLPELDQGEHDLAPRQQSAPPPYPPPRFFEGEAVLVQDRGGQHLMRYGKRFISADNAEVHLLYFPMVEGDKIENVRSAWAPDHEVMSIGTMRYLVLPADAGKFHLVEVVCGEQVYCPMFWGEDDQKLRIAREALQDAWNNRPSQATYSFDKAA